MTQIPWQRLPVQAFVQQFTNPVQKNLPKRFGSSTLVWQKQTIKDFFGAYQWAGHSQDFVTPDSFTLRLDVQTYFQHFRWNAPIKDYAKREKNNSSHELLSTSINLQKFSDLF